MAELPLKTSHFPTSALAFVDAIKKNRSCQKLIRSKMMQMEARIEELNKLVGRVKILKDFQAACKKRTVRALSQKKDARVQLISLPKLRATMKVNEKKIPASCKGPPENLHVANYKEAMTTFAVPVIREKWSKEEKENLVKGVKQQFQRMLLQRSIDLLSEENGSYDSGNVDSVIVSIKDIDITPEKLRLFLPKVNWEQLAAMYVPGHSGAECQARFLNYEDPLINHNPWTTLEDKSLLHIVQQKGLSDWIDIAASLGTNRTPFQCLARYQRSLNASILKREWTNEEDNQLRSAVEIYGESNWQVVASTMEGRTGTQCSNRWLKTLHPTRKRVGKWTADEDKRLIVAVTLFGPKTWKKIAGCVPGRTQVQCRERWVNCLDPSLNMADWTEEEDSKLEQAIEEHGYCWSKVAACIPRRTDNQCWRRWKVLFPTQVPLLQSARKIQKVALISNFVDRESERPALGPKDFRVPETHRIAGPESVDPPMEKKTRSRRRKAGEYNEEDARSSEASLKDVPRLTNGSLETSNGEEIRKDSVNDGNSKRKSRSKTKKSGLSSKLPNATNTSGTVIAIETNTNKYKHSDPNLEPEPGRKARKLQPRRRRAKTPEEVPELDALDDDPLYFPDSREAAPRIKAKKRKRETCSSSDCVSLDVDDRLDSEKTGNPQSETKRSSNSDDVSVYDHLRDGSCSNQTLDDDMTLAHFCNQVKRRIRHQTDIIRQIKL
ncbi:hypothetical protein ACS0TY_030526 [Phlomoides rotata]